MNEEIMRILEMVKDGKITTEDGEKLIAAVTGTGSTAVKQKARYSMLRVRVDARDPKKKDAAKVNVNVPLSVAKKVMGLVSLVPNDVKRELGDKGIDIDSIDLAGLIESFEAGELTEELVNIEAGDEEEGATVRVYVD